jgi:hypothetical protein
VLGEYVPQLVKTQLAESGPQPILTDLAEHGEGVEDAG